MSDATVEADVERSLERIAAAMDAEADQLADTYPLIAGHLRREASRLRDLTG